MNLPRFIALITTAELVQIKVDVLIAVTRQAALAAQSATTTIPTVFIAVPDPVGSKLIDSLARPGGNITGLTNMAVELVPKRMEVLKGGYSRSVADGATSKCELSRSRAALYRKSPKPQHVLLGVTLQPVEIRTATDIERAFSMITRAPDWGRIRRGATETQSDETKQAGLHRRPASLARSTARQRYHEAIVR